MGGEDWDWGFFRNEYPVIGVLFFLSTSCLLSMLMFVLENETDRLFQ